MNHAQIHVFEVVKSTAGVGQYARWLAQGLDRERFRLTYACVSEGGAELARDLNQIPGVQAFSLEMNRYHVDPLGDARLAAHLAQIIRRERFDLIHAHASKPGFLARLAAIGTHIPVIYRPACFAFHDGVAPAKARLIALIERLAARYLTTYIHCVCNDERDLARRYHVGSEQQLVTIYTGIDLQPFDFPVDRAALRAELGVPPTATLVGTVGRLSSQKAPLDFVSAAAQVYAVNPGVHFAWVGSGELEATARKLVEHAGLGAVFHFIGERRDVPRLLQAFDIFVLPSHWEGFSLSVLEAMAARLPVIATRVMGTAEAIVPGENGLLVPLGQPQELAQAMLDLAADPQRIAQYGENSRLRAEQLFTRSRMIDQVAGLYERAVRQNGDAILHGSTMVNK